MRGRVALLTILLLAACRSDRGANSAPPAEAAAPDSVVQYLLTAAATDFHTLHPADHVRVRAVHVGHLTAPNGPGQYVLCGEFSLIRDSGHTDWTPFATIKTSGYEQYLGAQATAFCEGLSIASGSPRDQSPSLQQWLDSPQPAPDSR